MSINKIQKAIKELSSEEFALFRHWFEDYCAEVWDEQIEAEAKSGRLDKFITEADEEKELIEERRNEPGRPLGEYLKEKNS